MEEQNLGIKILSLDGGGIRGLSSLILLEGVFKKLRIELGQNDLQPWQYFDLIGGTSTGGIIALMLGQLGMSIDECIEEYENLSEKIFKHTKGLGKEERFHSSKLEGLLKDTIERKLGDKNAPLFDRNRKNCCKTVVYAISTSLPDPTKPTALRSWCEPGRNQPALIWQAARATSAAHTFFKPLIVGNGASERKWMDASIKWNNPSRLLCEEAGEIWGGEHGTRMDSRHIGVLLSLGTGFRRTVRMGDDTITERLAAKLKAPISFVRVMKAIITDANTVAEELRRMLPTSTFYRFNVQQGLQEVEFFEYEKLGLVQSDTEQYLDHESDNVKACVRQMVGLKMLAPRVIEESHELETRRVQSQVEIMRVQNKKSCVSQGGLFYALNDEPRHIRETRTQPIYWSHMTKHAFKIYEAIYEDMVKNSSGYVTIYDFANYLVDRDRYPSLAKVVEVWSRVAKVDDLVHRSLVLAMVYMLHIEKYRPNERPQSKSQAKTDGEMTVSISEHRKLANECFGKWVPCLCYRPLHLTSCPCEWNFANNTIGLYRSKINHPQCLILDYHSRRLDRESAMIAEDVIHANLEQWTTGRRPPMTLEQAGLKQ